MGKGETVFLCYFNHIQGETSLGKVVKNSVWDMAKSVD